MSDKMWPKNEEYSAPFYEYAETHFQQKRFLATFSVVQMYDH